MPIKLKSLLHHRNMKRTLLFLLLGCFFVTITQTDAYGQRKNRSSDVDQYFDESGSIAHRLWYGGGFNLGFSGNGGFSAFVLGVSPMMGFKVFEDNDNFSIGPRLSLEYSYFRGLGNDNQTHSVQPLSYAFGVFTRYKVLGNFFAHVEGEFENRQLVITDFGNRFIIGVDGDPVTERDPRQNFYLGAGYNSGGLFAYEILAIYNVLEPDDSLLLPFDIRFGFTYKF